MTFWRDGVRIRILGAEETDLLKDFLYEAIFIPEGVEPPDRSIIELPELRVYYEDFGKGRADHCFVADEDGKVVGAVWSRIMNDYGHIDDETPSLAISLYKEYRGKGIGDRNFADEGYFGAAQGKGLQQGVAGGAKSQLRCPDV